MLVARTVDLEAAMNEKSKEFSYLEKWAKRAIDRLPDEMQKECWLTGVYILRVGRR